MREGRFCDRGNVPRTHLSGSRLSLLTLGKVGADLQTVREETANSFCVAQQLKVVGCCPGVQVPTVRRRCAVAPVTCWQMKSPAYRLRCGNIRMAVGVSREDGGL